MGTYSERMRAKLQAAFAPTRLEIVDDSTCIQLMRDFIAAKPELWNEDIGV